MHNFEIEVPVLMLPSLRYMDIMHQQHKINKPTLYILYHYKNETQKLVWEEGLELICTYNPGVPYYKIKYTAVRKQPLRCHWQGYS